MDAAELLAEQILAVDRETSSSNKLYTKAPFWKMEEQSLKKWCFSPNLPKAL